MQQQDYSCHFTVPVSADEVLEHIADVQAWWAKNFEGSARVLHDVFTVRFGGAGGTFVTFEITEYLPGKKVVWYVTKCHLHWIKDKNEWKGTSVVWEAEPVAGGTRVTMTHLGLVPEAECFEDCQAGWDDHVTNSLQTYIKEQVGMPV